MNKLNRTLAGIGLGLLTLCMVLPTLNTASADDYFSSSSNSGTNTAGVVVGVVAVGGVITALEVAKTKHTAPTQ
jgi:multisubunit Na+/H+ antiporter MnhB subunit